MDLQHSSLDWFAPSEQMSCRKRPLTAREDLNRRQVPYCKIIGACRTRNRRASRFRPGRCSVVPNPHWIVNRSAEALSGIVPPSRFAPILSGYRRRLPALIASLRTAMGNQCPLCSSNRRDGACRNDWWRQCAYWIPPDIFQHGPTKAGRCQVLNAASSIPSAKYVVNKSVFHGDPRPEELPESPINASTRIF